MPDAPPLPAPPPIAIRVVRDRTATSRADGGFVNVRRLDLEAGYPDGSNSPAFKYDVIDREAIDAVVVVAFERRGGDRGDREVWLRSCPRVPLLLRGGREGHLWELPAGIIDPHETPRAAARRELHEELGFDVTEDALVTLGTPTYPAPGFIAEQHFYFAVDVTGLPHGAPLEDGSALERGARLHRAPVNELLALCRAGALPDAKTELALRRFVEEG
jgi:ADP-ribose pyrophosphatase